MNLLVTGAWNATQDQLTQLHKLGYTVIWQQQENAPLVCAYGDVEACICNGLFLYHPIEKFTSLKLIQLTSAGYDRVPLDVIQSLGISIFNARGVYSIPIAEHTILGVLALYRRFADLHASQTAHKWEKIRNMEELNCKTVLILGCGSVGTECAKRFQAFNCKVIGIDLLPRNNHAFYDKMVSMDRLHTLLAETDVIVLALPLTDDTRHIIDKNRLSMLKHNAILVNIARGDLVDPTALEAELASGRIRAVLDVFGEEPLGDKNILWQLPQVVITPHVSYVGSGTPGRLWQIIQENLSHTTFVQ